MTDTIRKTSPFRHLSPTYWVVAVLLLLVGTALRCLASQGELWLDELWSLLHVAEIRNPFEIATRVKHDNNHLLNSLWLWGVGSQRSPWVYRFPSLVFSVIFLGVALRELKRQSDQRTHLLWFILLSTSYPLVLYSTEARGYSLTILMALVGYLSLTRLIISPQNSIALLTFSIAGMIGCLSHAIYLLFLAPAILWIGLSRATSSLNFDMRKVVRVGLLPPILTTAALTFTFYQGMEIGGAPLLPYLEVAASTISVSFGGEPLSATSPEVTGWSLFLALVILILSSIELVIWLRSRDPLALLVGLILITPWIAVWTLQPHFILPRYFLIQVVFTYLLIARFLSRLISRGFFGTAVALCLTFGVVTANTRHILQLWTFGRSHFGEIFATISQAKAAGPVTVGGEQDFQNSLRLRYLRLREGLIPNQLSSLEYIPQYRDSPTAPRFVIRETLDAYEALPSSFTDPLGRRYTRIRTDKAPPLSSSNVSVYELAQ